jgi:LuxR family maltose regulon positive regulatory protein
MTARPRSDVGALARDHRPAAEGEPAVEAVVPHRLRPPRSRVMAIERPALLGRIEEGLAGQVVCLQAPAGFGKSELLRSAFENLRRPDDRFCWMTLVGADNDFSVFLQDLLASLQVARRSSMSGRLRQAADAPQEGVGLARLSEALQDGAVAATLFLDDFQIPTSSSFRDGFDALLRRFPETLRVVLASRSRPAIPLAHLRARNRVVDLVPADLAFTPAEARDLADSIAEEDATRLLDITGGWPALMALGRRALGGDACERAAVFSGDHACFRDFIEDEVLRDLPADLVRVFEVCTVLDAFPPDLAVALAGRDAARISAGRIEGPSPVLQRLSQPPGWLRLHPLMRAALGARAGLRPPAEIAALHVRAATWFAERGFLDLAVRHAAHGGDFALAIDAIRKAGGVNIFLRAGYKTLTRLLADLPAAVVLQSPVLRLSHALVLAKQGQIQLAREIIDNLKVLGPGADTIAAPDLEHIDGMIDIYEDRNLGQAQIDALGRAARDLEHYGNWERGWIYNHLCIAHQREGDLKAARLTGLRALVCYREEQTPYAQIFMMGHVGTVLMAAGRLSAAINLLQEADTLAQAHYEADANLRASVLIPLATCLYHQGSRARASTMLVEALPVVKRGEGWVDMFARGYGTLARAKFLDDGLEAALAVLDEAEVLGVERLLPRLDLSVCLLRADLLTRAGLLDSAAQVLEALPPIASSAKMDTLWPTRRERHEALLVKARLAVKRDEPEQALALLHHLAASAEPVGAGLDLVAARVIATEALWALGRHDDALQQVLALLAFAMPQQITQPMRDGDDTFARILRLLVRRFGLTSFRSEGAAFLAKIFGALQPRSMGSLSNSAAVILTTREAEVLAGLERGAPNKEIARDLGLTEAAVKFHLKNLFRKLGVSRRALALSVAYDWGLIDGAGAPMAGPKREERSLR